MCYSFAAWPKEIDNETFSNTGCGFASRFIRPTRRSAAFASPQGKRFGDWTARCQETKTIARFRCFIAQSRIAKITQKEKSKKSVRRPVLSIAAGYANEEGGLGVILTVPLGIYLPAGLLLKVASAEPERVVITTCLSNGCRGTRTLKPETVEAMKKADEAHIEVINARGRKFAIPISLKGFAEALDALPKPPAK